MTASLHKLTAGSGYDYLTRQVAAQDSTEKGHASLTSYYTEKGEVPGRWVGSGLAGLGDVATGSFVDETQMRALFGAGYHPNMAARLAALPVGASREQIRDAARLGTPFKVFEAASTFQKDVAVRCSQWSSANGLTHDVVVPVDVRATIRNELATRIFTERAGRAPTPLELSTEVARLSRNPTTACAGYDVTFTPVKSVSALWAVAPQSMAAAIEAAHNAAVTDALTYLEQRVLYSRRGAGGVRQVDVRGLIAASFTHRDSRAGDPNLHTHVAIANKVQALDGTWLAIDGRPLFAGLVSVSEVYNTHLEAHLTHTLGLQFAAGGEAVEGKRSVREIVGVPSGLREAWSSRRAAIEARQAELAVEFQHRHLRPPTPAEAIALAQQATLETRQAKHEPRTLAEQRDTWMREATAVLGTDGVHRMLTNVQQATSPEIPLDPRWIAQAAAGIVETMGRSRASWNVWHLHAEASRQARRHASTPQQAAALTDQLLAAATSRCVALDGWADPISDPAVLRRSDGESMYTHVGTRRFTSQAVIDAEQRITDTASRTDGRAATEADVSLALLLSTADGVTLNAGQTTLVREMTTSKRRVQVALAAAGSGKTTAMAALARAWRESGGDVVGLAPSAVAASVLKDQLGDATTLAKLAFDLHHNSGPGDIGPVGPDTLVIIDEAGMADTPTLATIIDHAIERGASVRLIGDDQQLAAVGAGGVLRDLVTTHGAVHLTTIMRFTDPAEAAASLALREGRPEAVGYYLDHDRIHAGTDETVLRDTLNNWLTDRANGFDSLMLAGTRHSVATLNQWARAHRLTSSGQNTAEQPNVLLSDDNQASIGDLIVTRLNDRRLTTSSTDWVKNGDRWTITAITPAGAIHAKHRDNGLTVELPPAYVANHVELGYAVTIHGAQGITVDTTHTVITGTETRQQLYVAMSRGRHSNHTYIQIVDATDENAPIHPATLRPTTATDTIEAVLARDGSARSAATEQRQATDPTARLRHAVARYTDALHLAAELHNPTAAAELDRDADHIVDGLTASPAWPTLRAHLLLAADDSTTPAQLLRNAVDLREVASATDAAAVLTWRLPTQPPGPLPWLPAIPHALTKKDCWGAYLTARADQVASFTDEVRTASAAIAQPAWALPGQPLNPHTIADIEVWRAAVGVEPDDRRPTGPPQLGTAARRHQLALQERLATPTAVWTDLLRDIRDDIPGDPYATALAHRLAALHTTGVPITALLAEAVAEAPLPGEHPAAALWWRLTRHLTNTPAAAGIPTWEAELPGLIGIEPTIDLEASPWWPHLATEVTTALTHGIPLNQIITPITDLSGFDDACQALLWRTHQLTATPPSEDEEPPHPDQIPPEGIEDIDWSTRNQELARAARLRLATKPDLTALELSIGFAEMDRWADEPHTQQRLEQLLEAATTYYQQQLPGSWSANYLTERFRTDLSDDHRFRIGHAPAGWTNLVSALRKQGFSTDEMLAAGVATTTRTGNTIDRFRNRAIIPIHNQHGIVTGFIGRRHPEATDQQGPKYLNSPATAVFQKRHLLYGAELLTPTAIPVLVEGPMDAIAVTLAGEGTYIGVAPLGTSLTPEQTLLLRNHPATLLATDADPAGDHAAENAFWLLAQHRFDPHRVNLPNGSDPAQLLHEHGVGHLRQTLADTQPQARAMIHDHTEQPAGHSDDRLIEITAARAPHHWPGTLLLLDSKSAERLVSRINAWTGDPGRASRTGQELSRTWRRHGAGQPPSTGPTHYLTAHRFVQDDPNLGKSLLRWPTGAPDVP
ncbi:MobF family relaxase [Tessaracoccus sp. MC1756]|uniref:MobF family relaxase n=1 Tax=Tessaracoccus sp. MC1756 TaxID=2760311 RepID=UPI0016029D7C|nr:relaxase domain-containing protein [Tessaracoccus sp. MC1756]